ncbi:protein indeterminate-domain 12 [Solanum lycopersicum]|uniref:C2H2-type domain-containing protein n=1 Tax=Solanum lycopersicum TaxID=4081 RepID=A0A3Q7I4C6_SOLLC|nr:protein indeterminate-domain 9 [Solanum lycopersicum]
MYNEEDIRNKQIYHQNTGCFIFSEESTSVFSSMAQNMVSNHNHHEQPPKIKKKRNLPGNPDPDAEVVALSPKTLLATNRFVCEICNKGFQRDQNLQLHRRGHNLPWKLKQRTNKENKKKAYVCPEPTCVHHHPSRALGDLTGIKKHFCRKHGEKKWKCDKCSKIYAVQSDWKAHSKTCGTKEYRCDCGTLFARKDSFVTHRAFCDALAEESARLSANSGLMHRAAATSTIANSAAIADEPNFHLDQSSVFPFPANQRHFANPPPPQLPISAAATGVTTHISLNPWEPQIPLNPNHTHEENHHQITHPVPIKTESIHFPISSSLPFYHDQHYPVFHRGSFSIPSPQLAATALLQRATTMGTNSTVNHVNSTMAHLNRGTLTHVTPNGFLSFGSENIPGNWQKRDNLTRDFLGLTGDHHHHHDHDDSSSSAGGVGGGGGGGQVLPTNGNVGNGLLLSYGGNRMQDFQQTLYERDNSVLKHHPLGFGFAGAGAGAGAAADSTTGTWGDC